MNREDGNKKFGEPTRDDDHASVAWLSPPSSQASIGAIANQAVPHSPTTSRHGSVNTSSFEGSALVASLNVSIALGEPALGIDILRLGQQAPRSIVAAPHPLFTHPAPCPLRTWPGIAGASLLAARPARGSPAPRAQARLHRR